MFWRKKNRIPKENLDDIGREVVHAAGLSDDEAAAASSRLRYAGVRARILAAQNRQAQPGDNWLMTLLAAKRAIPAMIAIAIFAAAVLWLVSLGASGVNSFNEAVAGTGGTKGITLSCAIATRDECAMTTDEVLATIVSRDEQEANR